MHHKEPGTCTTLWKSDAGSGARLHSGRGVPCHPPTQNFSDPPSRSWLNIHRTDYHDDNTHPARPRVAGRRGGGRTPPPPSGRGGGLRSGNKRRGGRGGTPSHHERTTNRFLLLNSVNGPKFSDGGMKPAGITRNELDCRNRPYVEGGGRIPPPPSGRGGGPRSGNKRKGGRGGTPLTSSSPHLLPVHADTVPAIFVPPLTGFPDTGDQPVRAFRVLLPFHGRISPVAPQLVHTGKCIRKSIGTWLAGGESARAEYRIGVLRCRFRTPPSLSVGRILPQ